MELSISIAGGLLILLGLIHLGFPRYFKWHSELSQISLVNREMMYIHTLFIGITVFLMGVLCVSSQNELTTTTLGKRVSLGLGIFWSLRLLVQFFGYSSALWKGKKTETTIHYLLTALWIYFSLVFTVNYFL